jgi:metallo-beta-lactamase family protein
VIQSPSLREGIVKVHLTFHGAAQVVTGSKYELSIDDKNLLVDCGLFQGPKRLRALNWAPASYSPKSLERVLLTHAHLDHAGALPRLVNAGFGGPILATGATIALCDILLKDAGRLQEEDAKYANKKGFSKHKPAMPLFTEQDAEKTLTRMKPVAMEEWIDLGDGVRARWRNAGHILGSAMIEVGVDVGGRELTIVFSGDLGRYGVPLHTDPKPRPDSDFLVIESTYGNRTHPGLDVEAQLGEVLRDTLERKGVVLIPAFAVGRSQLVTLILRKLMTDGKIPQVPIHIDSPMAIDATRIYSRYLDELHLDERTFADGRTRLFPDNVHFCQSVEESKELNRLPGPRIIIAGSGMITGGRILHHLVSRLDDPKTLVCLVGYQAEGTRGRDLVRGKEFLRIHGRDVPVRAKFVVMNGLSGHGDANELMRWYQSAKSAPAATFVTHGEPKSSEALGESIAKVSHSFVKAPAMGDRFELVSMLPKS